MVYRIYCLFCVSKNFSQIYSVIGTNSSRRSKLVFLSIQAKIVIISHKYIEMATGFLETGPKLDWTRDNKIFDRYQIWKEKVELIFSSALEESSSKQKVSYLRYWMGEQGIPLVKKWTALGKLDFSSSEEDALSSGYILQNYWNLREAEFKPKGNKLLSVIELWTRSKQGSKNYQRCINHWLQF